MVCMENFHTDGQIVRMPKCQHYFHPTCIVQWFKSTTSTDHQLQAESGLIERRCPLCNVSMTIEELVDLREERLVK